MRVLLSLLGVFAVTLPALPADPPKQFTFPDPLTMADGTKVATKEQWETKRRPELRELFQAYMYGRSPAVNTKVTGKVLFEDGKAFGGIGTLKEVELSLGIKDCPPIYLLIATPNDRPKTGAPVFVGLNFSGNHTLTTDERVRVTDNWMYPKYPGVEGNKATAAGRGKVMEKWPLAEIVKAGYAVVTCYNGDIEEDRKEANGPLRPFVVPPPPGGLAPDHTATVMLWAWGVHRMVDFVTADKTFDPKRVAVIGHSRLGKTALLAGAFDERIACVFPHQAGCGGTGPSRHDDPKAESVKRINTSFPHWFSGSFKTYNDAVEKLPFDQHCLLALCAPRPVLYTNATEDQWANPTGQFEMMKRATPVYELLGVKGMEAAAMPAVGTLADSRLGYWIRTGQHEHNPEDWKTFIAFADKWMK
jgi:hypothetical protein